MSTAIELRPARGAQEWDEAVAAQPGSTPFHTWDYLEPAARDWGVSFEPTLAHHAGSVVGVVPQLVDRRLGLRWTNHLTMVNYLGPAVDREHLPATLTAMINERWRTVRDRQEVRVAPEDAPEVRGWTRRTASSMIVPLADRTLAEVEAQASKGFRHAPKQAL